MSRIDHYDVLIAGAGPAGATAAYILGRAGARVLVLEREKLPRYKPCGGAVPRAVYRTLPFSLEDLIEAEPEAVTYCWQAGQQITVPLEDRPITMVTRAPFDYRISQQAGTPVRDQTILVCAEEQERGITVRTEAGHVLHADFLVGADGAHSKVAQCVGLRRRRLLFAALAAEVQAEPDGTGPYRDRALFDFGVLPWSYLWVFPKRQRLSVGIGLFRARGQHLRQTLVSEMARLGLDLRGALIHGHTLPVYQGREPLGTPRVLLAGDAAGLVDPLSGEGIRHAVESGRLAAHAILDGQVHRYTERIGRYARRALEPARTLANVLYGHPQACFRYGMRNPRATRIIASWMSGEASRARIMTELLVCALEGALSRR